MPWPFIASGSKRRDSAISNAGTRKTAGLAPVTATRVPVSNFAAKTPTRANREASLGIFA